MASYSLRLILVYLLAAILLNITNYFFIKAYNAARLKEIETLSDMEKLQPLEQNYWLAAEKFYDINEPKYNNQTNNSQLLWTIHSSSDVWSKITRTPVWKEIKNCPEIPPGLGPELVNRTAIAKYLHKFKSMLNDVKPGGTYKPKNCRSQQSAAIIIAYRGCKKLLITFMNIIHPFLMKQQLDYQIFVIEQSNKTQPYNRGKLLNVGFKEAMRLRKDGFQCIILHEPHVVPTDTRNLYRCGWYPKQLATIVERPAKMPYLPLLGGAVAITPEMFLKLNGFSNVYWGNDADYKDLYTRINASNFYIENSVPLVGKYKSIKKGLGLWNRSADLSTPSPSYLKDGLKSLSYTVDKIELKRLFTYLQVNIDSMGKTGTHTKIYDKLVKPITYETAQYLKKYNGT